VTKVGGELGMETAGDGKRLAVSNLLSVHGGAAVLSSDRDGGHGWVEAGQITVSLAALAVLRSCGARVREGQRRQLVLVGPVADCARAAVRCVAVVGWRDGTCEVACVCKLHHWLVVTKVFWHSWGERVVRETVVGVACTKDGACSNVLVAEAIAAAKVKHGGSSAPAATELGAGTAAVDLVVHKAAGGFSTSKVGSESNDLERTKLVANTERLTAAGVEVDPAVVHAAVVGNLKEGVVTEPVVHADGERGARVGLMMVTAVVTTLSSVAARSSVVAAVAAAAVVAAVDLDHGNGREAGPNAVPTPVRGCLLAGALDRNITSVPKFELDDGVALAVVGRADVAELSWGADWEHRWQEGLRRARGCWEVEHGRA